MPASNARWFSPIQRAGRAAVRSLALIVIVGSAAPAAAQTKEMTEFTNSKGQTVDLTPFKDPKKVSALMSALLQAIPTGKTTGDIEANSLETLAHVRIAELTWPSADPKQTFEQRRMALKYRVMRSLGSGDNGQAPDMHDKANGWFTAALPKIAADAEYPIQSRYNAILLLGQLDKVEPNSIVGRPAVPLAEALPLLLSAYQSTQLDEILRIGALVGIARHAELPMKSDERPKVAAELLKTVAAKTPPTGFSTNGHHWARKLAFQGLTGLARAGGGADVNQPEIVKAAFAVVDDPREPLFLRREACFLVGALDPGTLAAVKPNDWLKTVANFTHDVAKAGSPRSDPSAPLDLASAADVLPAPPEGKGFNLPGTKQLDESAMPKKQFADGVAYYVHGILAAIGGKDGKEANRGIKAIPGADPADVNELTKNVNAMLVAMTPSSTRLNAAKLVSDLGAIRSTLETWMQGKGLLKPPAAGGQPAPAGGAAPMATSAPPAATTPAPTTGAATSGGIAPGTLAAPSIPATP